MKPKIFFSHGFGEEKNEAIPVAFFKKLLEEEIGKENVLEGTDKISSGVYEKTLGKIEQSQGVFVIFPRRGKIENGGGYATSENIVFETGYAEKKGIPCFGFREKGVEGKRVGMIQYSSRNHNSSITFEEISNKKAELEVEKETYRTFIRNEIKKIERKDIVGLYCYPSCEKEVAIYERGYGRIRTRYTLKILRDGLPEITSMKHHFDLKDLIPKGGGKIPCLSKIMEGTPAENFKKELPFFSYEITKGKVSSFKHAVISESGEEVDFNFIFKGDFKEGDILEYEWLIQGSGFFQVHLSDLEKKRMEKKLEYLAESNFRLPDSSYIESFKFVVEFKKGVNALLLEPVFEVYQGDTRVELPRKAETVQKNTLRDRYESVFENIRIPSGHITARWTPN